MRELSQRLGMEVFLGKGSSTNTDEAFSALFLQEEALLETESLDCLTVAESVHYETRVVQYAPPVA